MNTIAALFKKNSIIIGIYVISILIYTFILMFINPLFIGVHWQQDYLVIPFLLTFFYYATRKTGEDLKIYLTFLITLSLYGIILSEIWGLGTSTASILAGKLPYSDASNYLDGAIRLLEGEKLSLWTSRRPLATAWLYINLYLTGGNLKGGSAMMALFCSIGITCAITPIRKHLGTASAWITHLILFFYYRTYLGTTLSEQAGFFLGCLAFTLLWKGAALDNKDSSNTFLIGLLVLSMGLLARAGTFFVLPILVLYYALKNTKDKKNCLKRFIIASCVILIAFAGNRLLLQLIGFPSAAFGNFSHTLYGLVHGGSWTQATFDHPELRALPEIEANQRIYLLAFKQIREHPTSLLEGFFRAYKSFFYSPQGAYSFTTFSFQYSPISYLLSAVKSRNPNEYLHLFNSLPKQLTYSYLSLDFWFLGCSLLGLLGCIRWAYLADRYRWYVLSSMLGILLSVPFLPPWDAPGMRVYATAIPFFALFPAYALANKKYNLSNNEKNVSFGFCEISALALCFFLIFFPIITKKINQLSSPLANTAQHTNRIEKVKILSGSIVEDYALESFLAQKEILAYWLQDENILKFGKIENNMALGIAYFEKGKTIGYVYWNRKQNMNPGQWVTISQDIKADRSFLREIGIALDHNSVKLDH